MQRFYAKSSREDGTQVTVQEHLAQVSRWAEVYGADIGMPESARLAGLMHDFGKYSADFQDLLKGMRTGVDHAACGAAVLYQTWKAPVGIGGNIIEAVNGHHGGLMGRHALYPLLRESLQETGAVTINDQKQSPFAEKWIMWPLCSNSRRDFHLCG